MIYEVSNQEQITLKGILRIETVKCFCLSGNAHGLNSSGNGLLTEWLPGFNRQ